MKTVIISLVGAVLITLAVAAVAGTGVFIGESIKGINRICYYDYMGSTYVVTFQIKDLCPMTIEVD